MDVPVNTGVHAVQATLRPSVFLGSVLGLLSKLLCERETESCLDRGLLTPWSPLAFCHPPSVSKKLLCVL